MLRTVTALVLLLISALAADAGLLHVRFEPDLVLQTDIDGESVLGELGQLVVATDGSVYVADSGFMQIHAFGPDGVHRKSFGQAGGGPGDLPRPFALSIDENGHLLVFGNSSTLAWIDGEGNFIRSIERNRFGFTQSAMSLPNGGLLLAYPAGNVQEEPYDPDLLHELDATGSVVRSFAKWGGPENLANPRWSGVYMQAMAVIDHDGTILLVRSQPFELRRYRVDGTLLHATASGAGDFLHTPRPPQIRGDTTSFRSFGGPSGPVPLEGGRVMVSATRVHPEDLDYEPGELQREPRWQQQFFVYDAELRCVAASGIRDGSAQFPAGFDAQHRVWLSRAEPQPGLVRHRVVLEVMD